MAGIEELDLGKLSERQRKAIHKYTQEEEQIKENHQKHWKKLQHTWNEFEKEHKKQLEKYYAAVQLRKEGINLGISENQIIIEIEPKIEKKNKEEKELLKKYKSKLEDVRNRRERKYREFIEKGELAELDASGTPPAGSKKVKPHRGSVAEELVRPNPVIELIGEGAVGGGDNIPQVDNNQEVENQIVLLELERERELRREINQLDDQLVRLNLKERRLREETNNPDITEYRRQIHLRQRDKVQKEIDNTFVRKEIRQQIIAGNRVDFDIEEERELSDGGYSPVESDEEFQHNFPVHTYKILRRQRRVARILREDYPDSGSEDSSDTDEEEGNMAGRLKWSTKDIPQFQGITGENPSTHLMEFHDFLNNIGINAGTLDQPENAETLRDVIKYFVSSLKGRARQWLELNFGVGQRATYRHWQDIQREFRNQYNLAGSTREQQIKVWKDLKWNPATESLDDFVYKYRELGNALGYTEEQLRQGFLCCIPSHMYLYVMNAPTMIEAVNILKKCLALGTGLLPEIRKEETKTPVVPFMMSTDARSVNFSPEVMMAENLKHKVEKVVEDRVSDLKSQAYTISDKVDSLAAAFDRFRMDRDKERDRDRDRDRDRGRSPDRGGIQRRDSLDRRRSDFRGRSPERGREGYRGSNYSDRDRERRGSFQGRDNQNFGQRDRSNSGGRGFQRQNSGSRFPRDTCKFCGKIGHTMKNCWALEEELAKIGVKIVRGNGRGLNGNRNGQGNRDFSGRRDVKNKEYVNYLSSMISELREEGMEVESEHCYVMDDSLNE